MWSSKFVVVSAKVILDGLVAYWANKRIFDKRERCFDKRERALGHNGIRERGCVDAQHHGDHYNGCECQDGKAMGTPVHVCSIVYR
jgi:hypothetical protein